MPTEKRQRKREGRQARLEAMRHAAQRKKRVRQIRTAAILIGGLFLVFVAISVFGREEADEPPAAGSTTTTSASAGVTYGDGACAPTTKPDKAPESFDAAPRRCIVDGVDYSAVVTTSDGVFTMDLLEDEAPITVNNFVNLARWGWYDGGSFSRVVRDFVNQANGANGNPAPGYSIPDELPDSLADYPKGTVAMANRGPDTGGHQWFVCIDCANLPGPNFAIFGRVTDGLEVADAINDLGPPGRDGPPSRPVTIESIEIVED